MINYLILIIAMIIYVLFMAIYCYRLHRRIARLEVALHASDDLPMLKKFESTVTGQRVGAEAWNDGVQRLEALEAWRKDKEEWGAFSKEREPIDLSAWNDDNDTTS